MGLSFEVFLSIEMITYVHVRKKIPYPGKCNLHIFYFKLSFVSNTSISLNKLKSAVRNSIRYTYPYGEIFIRSFVTVTQPERSSYMCLHRGGIFSNSFLHN